MYKKPATLTIETPYKVTAQKAVSIYPLGTSFPPGMLAYYYASQPTVEVRPQLQRTGGAASNLNVSIQTSIQLQAVNDQSEVYWSTTLSEIPDQKLTSESQPIVLYPAELYQRVIQIRDELNFQNGVFRILIASQVSVQGSVQRQMAHLFAIELQQTSFTMPKSEGIRSTMTLPSHEDGERPRQLWGVLGLSILTLAQFLGIMYIVIRKKQKPQRWRAWITTGAVGALAKPYIRIESLEGLIDIAVDMNKRVIHDTVLNQYFVITEACIYTFYFTE
jgi:hypothetical protein